MKELSIEQKAKAYDEAIKIVENIKTGKCETTFMFTEGLFEYVFPELAQSEDEKIRKELITHCRNIRCVTEEGAERIAKWIVWLKKQGKQDNWAEELNNKIKELHKQCLAKIQENNTPTIVWHSVSEEPEEMKELFCEWESDDATWHDVAFYDEESHTFRHAKMPINVTKWV